jgi:hypothetical protein
MLSSDAIFLKSGVITKSLTMIPFSPVYKLLTKPDNGTIDSVISESTFHTNLRYGLEVASIN